MRHPALMTSAKREVPQLVSNRLTLRPFRITDAPALARITNDPLLLRNLLRTASPYTAHDARRMILRLRKRKAPVWAIDNGQLIGLIGLAGEFGLWLGRSAWGKGYAEEASRLVIDHAFTEMKLSALHANPISDNRASCHLMQKLGFTQMGSGSGFCLQRSRIVTLVQYRLRQDEFVEL